MRSTGAELRVVVRRVLQWRWSEGATLFDFIERSTALREEPLGKAKPFDISKRALGSLQTGKSKPWRSRGRSSVD
jgi:hypothetical protein